MSRNAPRHGSLLRVADEWRPEALQRSDLFESPSDLEEFFRACDALEGPEREPDWAEHLCVIQESRGQGAADS